MSTRALKMTASVKYIRKLIGKSSCATNNLLNTGHKTQKNTSDSKTIRNKEEKSEKRNDLQSQDKTNEQCIRKSVSLRRKENETFGFDIQASGAEPALGFCVCWVKEDGLAERSGLMTGDVIVTVNSVHIAGFTHQRINDLVQKSSFLMIEIIRGSTEKQRQLLRKLYLLQQQFTEKCEELQTLITEEMRLRGGVKENLQEPALPTESSVRLVPLQSDSAEQTTQD